MPRQPDMIDLPADDGERQALADRVEAADDAVDERRWPSMLTELLQVLEARYLRRGMSAADAFALARDSVLEIAEHLGGRVAYLPRGKHIRVALRNAEIYRRCNGRNHGELAKKYDLNTIQIYRICREQRRLNVGRLQGQLALTEEGQP